MLQHENGEPITEPALGHIEPELGFSMKRVNEDEYEYDRSCGFPDHARILRAQRTRRKDEGGIMNAFFIAAGLMCIGLVAAKGAGDGIPLPAPALKGKLSVEEAMARRRSVREFRKGQLSLAEVSQILWAAQGVTKRTEGFRTVPSAGATYPLETYLVAGEVEGLAAGTYRYDPASHSLRRTAEGDVRKGLSDASWGQPWVREAPATIAIAAVYARTASRYGARARRYIDMEVGHAGQNIYLQAESLGLGTVAVGAFDDGEVKKVLGLPKEEEPLYLMPLGRR